MRGGSGGIAISTSISSGSSAVVKRPAKKSAASTQRSPPARCRRKRALQRHGQRRQLGGRIGVRQAAAEGAAVADLRVGDERHRLVEQRRRLGHQRVALQPALPRQGADPQAAVLVAADEVQLGRAC